MAKKQDSGFEGFNILVQDSVPLTDDDFVTGKVTEIDSETVKGGDLLIPKKEDVEVEDPSIKETEAEENSGAVDDDEEEIPEEIPSKNTENVAKKDKKGKENEVEASEESDPFKAFSALLGEKGVIDYNPETFDHSEEGLIKGIEDEIEAGIETYKTSLGQESQKYIEFLERGGDPTAYIQKKATFSFLKTTEDQVKSDTTLQKNVIQDLLTKDGYDFEEIKDKLTDYEEAGILEKESLRALKKVKAQDVAADNNLVELQKQEETRKQEAYKGYLKTLEDMINKKTEIAGFKIADKQKKSFYDYITKSNVDLNGQPATQMQADIATDADGQLKMAWFYFNKFDMTKFKKQADSKAASGLREALGRYSDSREKVSKHSGSSGDKPDLNIFKKNLNI